LKFFLDFFPIAVFFVAFKVFDIYVATTVAMVTTLLQIGWLKIRHGKVEAMQWVSLAVIGVFGGATLLLHDESFIKWKPTALYWLLAVALWGAQIFTGRNLMRSLMAEKMSLPDKAWNVLLHSWAGFFLLMGSLNLWIAHEFDTETWVNFKLFGGMGLMLIFVFIQAFFLAKFLKEDNDDDTR